MSEPPCTALLRLGNLAGADCTQNAQKSSIEVLHTVLTPSSSEERRSFSSSEGVPSITPKATQRSQNFSLHHSLATNGTLAPCSRPSKVFANAADGFFKWFAQKVQPRLGPRLDFLFVATEVNPSTPLASFEAHTAL